MELALFFDDAVAMVEEGGCDQRKCFDWIHLRVESRGRFPKRVRALPARFLHKGVCESRLPIVRNRAIDGYLIVLDGGLRRLPHDFRHEGQLIKLVNFDEIVRRARLQKLVRNSCCAELRCLDPMVFTVNLEPRRA